jgi:copper(I)-binding protein
MISPRLQKLIDALGRAERVESPSYKAVGRTIGLALIGVGPFLLLGMTHTEPVARANGVSVIHPWSSGTALIGDDLRVYATFENAAPRLDRLVAVETNAATNVVFEKVNGRNPNQRADELGEIDLAPATRTSLRPDYQQIRLIGLKQKVEPGSTLPVEFIFARAGRLKANVRIESPGEPPHSDHS